MRLDYLDYIKLVIAGFKKKQQDSEHPLLPTFTRASIRQECLKVYTGRLNKGEGREINTLRDFFGVPNPREDFRSLIEWFPLDKFRPLEKLMKGKIQNPVLANVELLAWLIDFKHRPYTTGMNVVLNEEEIAILNKPKIVPVDFEPSKTEEEEESKAGSKAASFEYVKAKGKRRKVKVIASFLLAATLGGAYIIWQHKTSGQVVFGKTNIGCMYWIEDHYEKVPCNEERKGGLVLPLNKKKMKNFKRITRVDTITERSIGKVYYIKNNGTIEYYTEGGNHPVETTRSLKKLSAYMFDKYLRKQEIANKDSVSDETLKFINNR